MKTNLITIELKSEIGNTKIYKITYMDTITYNISMKNKELISGGENIESVPGEVIKFVEDWLLEKF